MKHRLQRLRSILLALSLLGVITLIMLANPRGTSAAPEGQVREIVIHARAFEYTPRTVYAQKGERIRITLIADDVTHGFVLEKYGLELEASPRDEEPSTIEFVADEAGKYHFRCTIVCGPFHPFMVGALVVEPYNKLQIAWSLTLIVAFMSIAGVQRFGFQKEKDPLDRWTFELTSFSWVRELLKKRWFQYSLMVPNIFFFVVILVAAFFGSPVGNANFAIIYVWIVWWAALKFFFIPIGGRFWCTICPLPLPGDWLDRRSLVAKGRDRTISSVRKAWPKWLDNLWLQNLGFLTVCMFSGLILTRPLATGIVLVIFIGGGMVMSVVYGRRVFCRYACPISGFIGMYSMVAPLEIRVIDEGVCKDHTDKTCIKGDAHGYGCPWLNYPGGLERNAFCGMCTECFKTCPSDNMGLFLRPFGRDLFVFSGRGVDEIYNAFIMLSCALIYIAVFLGPWGVLKDMANIASVPLYLLYLFLFILTNLVIMPGLFYIAVWLGKGLAEGQLPPAKEAFNFVPILWQKFKAVLRREKGPKFPRQRSNVKLMDGNLPSTQKLFTEYGYTIIPLGLTGWIAFTVAFALVDISYAIPLISDPMGWGWNLLGTADYSWVMYIPHLVPYIQIPLMLGGLAISVYVVYRIGIHHISDRKMLLKSLIPVFGYLVIVTGIFFWLVL